MEEGPDVKWFMVGPLINKTKIIAVLADISTN